MKEPKNINDIMLADISKRVATLEDLQEKNFVKVLDTLSSRLKSWIEQEVRSTLSEQGVRQMISKITKSMIDANFIRVLSANISERIMNRTGSKLRHELNQLKSLAYSIDLEINRVYHRIPCDYDKSKKIVQRIEGIIEKQASVAMKEELKMIDEKQGGE